VPQVSKRHEEKAQVILQLAAQWDLRAEEAERAAKKKDISKAEDRTLETKKEFDRYSWGGAC